MNDIRGAHNVAEMRIELWQRDSMDAIANQRAELEIEWEGKLAKVKIQAERSIAGLCEGCSFPKSCVQIGALALQYCI